MLLPIRTDRPLRTTPYVNYAIIAANVVVFAFTMRDVAAASAMMAEFGSWLTVAEQYPVVNYYLHPTQPRWYQFISSAFLHADWMHLLGNMLLLYVFGNNVEDRLGHFGYLGFYLAAGVFAGLGHAGMETSPVLGASGAVSGVTGGFLALFPLTRISVLFFFFIIGFIEVPGIVLIMLWFAQDAIYYLQQFGGVAYLAHLTGSFFGFLTGIVLLKSRLLAREPYDMLSMLEHRRRRAHFTALTRKGYHPWDASPKGKPTTAADAAPPISDAELRVLEQRAEIARAIAAHNLDRAAELYAELLDRDASQTLSLRNQIDLANHFASQQRYDLAARAYELLLNTYTSFPDREQIELMLALIYMRYLNRRQRARELLNAALPSLHDREQKQLAESMLAGLNE